MKGHHARNLLLFASLGFLVLACVSQGPGSIAQHRWWAGLGPVLPHDSFPADCQLCHAGQSWQSVRDDFEFDHEGETGVRLEGAHAVAQCLRCHNDRGPARMFADQGCAGCHEDLHLGQLGNRCEDCHQQLTWRPQGQIEGHAQTRFPLVGVHAQTSCRRCHPGAEVGRFVPTDTECVTCHAADLAGADNPDHVALGWVVDCDRCHRPTSWFQVELDVNFPGSSSGSPGFDRD